MKVDRSDINRLAVEAGCAEITVVRWLRGERVLGVTRSALQRAAELLAIDDEALQQLKQLVA